MIISALKLLFRYIGNKDINFILFWFITDDIMVSSLTISQGEGRKQDKWWMVQKSHQMIHAQSILKFIDGHWKKEGYIIQVTEWIVCFPQTNLTKYLTLLWLLASISMLSRSLKLHRESSRDRSCLVLFCFLFFLCIWGPIFSPNALWNSI